MTSHAKHTYFQACKNPSYQSAPFVTITVSLYSMKKGSQSMTKRRDRLSCRATETQTSHYTWSSWRRLWGQWQNSTFLTHSGKTMYMRQNRKQEVTLFYHAACFSPIKRTFVDAIKINAFASWPGLTVELVNNYLPRTGATIKGHIRQQYKGTKSTRMRQEGPSWLNNHPQRS